MTLRISPKVRRVLDTEKIPVEELIMMVEKSAITSLRTANRRYFRWLFTVVDEGEIQHVTQMELAQPVEVGSGEARVLEEHEPCQGEGCRACGWIGVIVRRISDATAQDLSRPVAW